MQARLLVDIEPRGALPDTTPGLGSGCTLGPFNCRF